MWPFVAQAVAINMFLLRLISPLLGLPALWPSLPLGLVVIWIAARRLRRLTTEGEAV